MFVTELETKEMVPSRKLVPMFKIMPTTKVSSRTGTSAKVWEVKSSTATMMTATYTIMTLTSRSMVSSCVLPSEVET